MESVFGPIRGVGGTLRGIVDQINPLSDTNVTLYFIWLVVIVSTGVAVWRAERRWLRGALYLVHQTFTVGIVINWVTAAIVAYHFWRESLALAASCFALTFWLCRRRRHEATLRLPAGPSRRHEQGSGDGNRH